MRLLLALLAVAQASAAGNLSVTFKDCGVNAYAKVLTVAPDSLPLGKTTTISGTGQVKNGRIFADAPTHPRAQPWVSSTCAGGPMNASPFSPTCAPFSFPLHGPPAALRPLPVALRLPHISCRCCPRARCTHGGARYSPPNRAPTRLLLRLTIPPVRRLFLFPP